MGGAAAESVPPQQKLHLLAPLADAVAFGQWQTAHRVAHRGARALIGSPLRYLGLIACVEALTAFYPRNYARVQRASTIDGSKEQNPTLGPGWLTTLRGINLRSIDVVTQLL